MQVELLAHTVMNPSLAPAEAVLSGAGTPQENLIEYAGRVCYRSDEKMGHNPGFISARVREGHEDIVEHVRFVFRVQGAALDMTILALANQPTVEYTDLGGGSWIFSLNARNVRDFYARTRSELGGEMARLAAAVTPSVYADLAARGGEVAP